VHELKPLSKTPPKPDFWPSSAVHSLITSRDHDHTTPWGYCDANYVEDPHDQKSTSSYLFMLAGGPIAWKSKKQSLVALSTTEAEYYALGLVCQEAVWL